jgi:tetratricopeptide (TPR) repeat protein
LGIGYFNIRQSRSAAANAYRRARAADPHDARLLYESDQLARRVGKHPAVRLRTLQKEPDLVRQRDDLTLELCALLNQQGQPDKSLSLLTSRRFQPWEGGEGLALAQHVRTHLTLGRRALAGGDAAEALRHFELALAAPDNLGESRHLLANQSDVHYHVGLACKQLRRTDRARRHFLAAAEFEGDFKDMAVQSFSELTYYTALARQQLGRKRDARTLLAALLAHARSLRKTPARIDYFATSLPTMLLFDDDLDRRQRILSLVLEGQALLGLGRKAPGRAALRKALTLEPMQPTAADLLNSGDLFHA